MPKSIFECFISNLIFCGLNKSEEDKPSNFIKPLLSIGLLKLDLKLAIYNFLTF